MFILVLAVGAREHQAAPGWGGYSVDELALRHGAGVEVETADAKQAYASFPKYEPTPYQNGWLPVSARKLAGPRLLCLKGHSRTLAQPTVIYPGRWRTPVRG